MFEKLDTEMNNPKTFNMDKMSIFEILRLINQEDSLVALTVTENLKEIENVVEECVDSLKHGGRIIYAGAGTSGRIAVMDAVETVPTFGVKDLFVPLMAGGKDAFFAALEAVEDNYKAGKDDLININVKPEDMVIGVTASGRTPYVKGIIEYAKEIGCSTGLVCNVKDPEIKADTDICLVTGPEVITGSTRMKAGTAQKMAMNMISTVSMIKMGKTYKNYMVDVMILNEKLEHRATNMISTITGLEFEDSNKYLKEADYKPKLAILMILSEKNKEECIRALEKTQVLNEALLILKEE
ncbi:N-acetylmuramic acid 6-phosphate etherase [Oceanotoga sp. DSM 15011]|jgi:N-acetylmuramic acid 6-phosphate etherase|uniref:N-acetylmuramic acid 6-phosphate etherase n=1 Tax=Oceanotoga teriensis TaxID=515440 RepID=A0AA45C502_9BACT|nr:MULTISPECIES: N-acetylmuramic acid 6-phosphate etherase [Oceanotoga]MDN5342868.1 N-acetylmuramic acid 6-phosphate etherase [Oceanotoga sp.]MDO7976600.1 N-acetylmuramic acid 6-phosphate etherase [Oceanotoga teriensis]PWJ87685.1 N-acetylmuramic acid 6-phosphate etherase [Oceanotoga teriensis]UYO99317.1 N-acetylmuramic acid 6-phosphate etherase [Oceanotoga sp. DSM 15011]